MLLAAVAAVAADVVAMLPVAADTAGVNPELRSPAVCSVAWYAFRV